MLAVLPLLTWVKHLSTGLALQSPALAPYLSASRLLHPNSITSRLPYSASKRRNKMPFFFFLCTISPFEFCFSLASESSQGETMLKVRQSSLSYQSPFSLSVAFASLPTGTATSGLFSACIPTLMSAASRVRHCPHGCKD